MMEKIESIDDALRELLASLRDYELGRAASDPAAVRGSARRREAAIRNVAEHGLSRRTIADMTGMSHTRVNQILEGQSRRAETMAGLEELEGEALADQLLALVYSNSLSREEMAEATGRSVEEVNRLIGEHAETLARRRHEKALAMVRRHMPPGWTP
jgi:plasmid maintenance system antidote protein VapI